MATVVRWYICAVAFALPFMFGSQIMATESPNYPPDFLVWLFLLFSPMGPGFLADLLAGTSLLLAIIAHPSPARFDHELAWTLLWCLPVAAGFVGLSVTTETDYARNWVLHFSGALCFGIAVWWTSRHDRKLLPAFASSIAVATLLICLYGWYQRLGGMETKLEEMSQQHKAQFGEELPQQIFQKMLQNRISSFFSDPNIFAAHLLVTIPITIAAIWRRLKDIQAKTRVIIMSIAILFLLVAFAWTESRGAAIGACVGLGMGVWMLPWLQKQRWKWLLPMLCVFFITGIICYASINASRGGLATASIRMNYYRAAWAMFREKPMTGIGLGEFYPNFMRMKPIDAEVSRDPHCFFLSSLSQCGLAGGLAVLAVMLFPFVATVRRTHFRTSNPQVVGEKSSPWQIPVESFLISGLAAWCIHSFFQFNELIPATVFLLPTIPLLVNAPFQPTSLATAEIGASKSRVNYLHYLALIPALACTILPAMKIPCEKRLQDCEDELMQLNSLKSTIQQQKLLFKDTTLLQREAMAQQNAVMGEIESLVKEMPFAPAPCRMLCEESKREILAAKSPEAIDAKLIATMKNGATALIERVPHRADAYCQLAWAELAACNWPAAEAALTKARQWFPWYAPHMLLSGVLASRSPAALQAIEHVQTWVQTGPNGKPKLAIQPQEEHQREQLLSLVKFLPEFYPDMEFIVNDIIPPKNNESRNR